MSTSRVITTLVKLTYPIVDEVGRYIFDRVRTDLLLNMMTEDVSDSCKLATVRIDEAVCHPAYPL